MCVNAIGTWHRANQACFQESCPFIHKTSVSSKVILAYLTYSSMSGFSRMFSIYCIFSEEKIYFVIFRVVTLWDEMGTDEPRIIEPPGVVLLGPDGMMVPQCSEDSKVSSHEIRSSSRVQLTIY